MIDRYALPKMKHVWSDEAKYDVWLKVELAVCQALAEKGVIPGDDWEKLSHATYDLVRLNAIFQRTKHDMTAFTRSITERLGPEGRWVHHGLTSQDVWDTGTALQMREAAKILDDDLGALEGTLKTQAVRYKDTLTIGRTHGVHAEPTVFGLKFAGWLDEVRRGRKRLSLATAEATVGKVSGVVGTHATVPPDVEARVCELLGIGLEPVSTQVVHRDRHAQFVMTLALIAASLEKFATEIRHLQRTEVHEVEEPFGEEQTGSSAMPHKRNPELTERVCGLARLIRGHAVTALENVALWHERDISHSSAERIILPDACMALDYILNIFTDVVEGLQVFPDRIQANLEMTRGLVFSQRVLLALIEKGMSREEAYKVVQGHAMRAWDSGLDFRELLRNDTRVRERLPGRKLEDLFDYTYYTRYTDESFKRVGLN
ncbi:MAG: adenylosuccinate lyase [Dehalococcoidia bacterium]|nr:adenylosuccinate lyase [Dehalococcoidia bacterium]